MENKKLEYLQGKLDCLLEQENLVETLMLEHEKISSEYKTLYTLWVIITNNVETTKTELKRANNGTEMLTGYEGIGYSDTNIKMVLERNFDEDEVGLSKDLEQQIDEYLESEEQDLNELAKELDELEQQEENK